MIDPLQDAYSPGLDEICMFFPLFLRLFVVMRVICSGVQGGRWSAAAVEGVVSRGATAEGRQPAPSSCLLAHWETRT